MKKTIIGDATLYLGDCNQVLNACDCTSDALITDPPYKMEIHGRGFAAKRDYYQGLDYGTNVDFVLDDLYYDSVLEQLTETNLVFFCNKHMKLDIENWAVGKKYTYDELVLLKSAPAPLTNNQWLPDKEFAVHVFRNCKVKGNYATKKTWFTDSNYQDKSVAHPSAKPVYILERIVRNVSNKGDTILDTFMGSGSTGVACIKQGRKFVGIEIDPDFYQVACERIQGVYDQPDLFAPTQDKEKSSQDSFI